MSQEVVYLAFDNPKIRPETSVTLLACSSCRNKTYRIEVHPDCGGKLHCAACNSYIGTMGWMPEQGE